MVETSAKAKHFVEYQGQKMTFWQLAKKTGVNHETLRYRVLKRGMSVEEAITHTDKKLFKGHLVSFSDLERLTGVEKSTISYRYKHGYSIRDAVRPERINASKKYIDERNRVEGCVYPDCLNCKLPDCMGG